MICEKCKIFPAWVTQAGAEQETVCYPCYMWYILGRKSGQDQAVSWLEIRRECGESEMVDQWYKWQNEKESKTRRQQSIRL